ncbi:MAG: hypothetical protein WC356_01170 [Candidatus Micrarchaeia archaeon]|jgi:hypothetical protein
MKTKNNGDIVFDDISAAVSFRRWWHGIVYLISFVFILYYLVNFTLEENVILIVLTSLVSAVFLLFLFTFSILLFCFILEKFLAFLNIQIGRPSLKLFLSYFKKNYGFSYSDYLKYLIIKTKKKLDDPLNRGVYLDEVKKSVKELKLEFIKIKNTLNDANMPDLNPSLMAEIKSVIFSLEEILQLKAITMDNKEEIFEYFDKLEKTIFAENFQGLTNISLNFEEAHKNSYLDKVEILFKLVPKKYFYGLIFLLLFLLLLIYLPETYKNYILIIYTGIMIFVLCFIKKE